MRAIAIVAVLVMLAMPAQADWPQYGGDAARTGQAMGGLPDWPDVALRFEQPFGLAGDSYLHQTGPAVIIGDLVYLASLDESYHTHIMAIDVQNATLAVIASFEWELGALASDGERLFLGGAESITSLELATGSTWSTPFDPTGDSSTGPRACGSSLIDGDRVYFACSHPLDAVGCFRTVDGAPCGYWSHAAHKPLPLAPDPQDPQAFISEALVSAPSALSRPSIFALAKLSLVGDLIYYAWYDPPLIADVGFDETHHTRGNLELLAMDRDLENTRSLLFPYGYPQGDQRPPSAVGDERYVFFKCSHCLLRIDSTDPSIANQEGTTIRDPNEDDLGSGFALHGDDLWVTTQTRLARYTVDLTLNPAFAPFDLATGEMWAPGPLLVSEQHLLASSMDPAGGHTLRAFDIESGNLLWSYRFPTFQHLAASDGLVVAMGMDGVVTILGRSSISPAAVPKASTLYPQEAEEVIVDLTASTAGALGPPTGYGAMWTEAGPVVWQDSPILRHKFTSSGDVASRFFVRNDAGQTASVPMTFHVGQADPSVNIFNSPFSDQYQETTFFILGLLITGILALLGVYRAGRKRRRLERELRELEADYKCHRDHAARCEEMLAERRTRARALFLERKLEEAHASFLVTRIDELRHGLRMNDVEQRLDFLPLGLVKNLREMLRDSRITQWERMQFLEALERDTLMTAKQKAQVRRVIEGWFASDSGLAY